MRDRTCKRVISDHLLEIGPDCIKAEDDDSENIVRMLDNGLSYTKIFNKKFYNNLAIFYTDLGR